MAARLGGPRPGSRHFNPGLELSADTGKSGAHRNRLVRPLADRFERSESPSLPRPITGSGPGKLATPDLLTNF